MAWTAGAVGVVLGGMLGTVAGGVLCEATTACELEGLLGAVLGFATALLIGFIGSWSLQPARFGVALVVLVPLFAVSGARMAARSSRP